MSKIYVDTYAKVDQYKLTKVQKAIVFQQLKDVFDQMDEDEINNEVSIDELIDEIFEYNDIPKVKNSKRKYINPNIFWGFMFIFAAILIMFGNLNFIDTLTILSIPFVIYLLIRRYFFISILIIALILMNFFNMGITVFIGLILIYLGLKIMFFQGHRHHEHINRHKEHINRHKEHMKKHYGNRGFKNSGAESKRAFREEMYKKRMDSINNREEDEEALFFYNVFNGNEVSLVNQKVSYVNLKNQFGGFVMDLRNYTFPNGDIIINIDNKFGGVEIYTNSETSTEVIINSFLGGVEYEDKLAIDKENARGKIYIQGENRFGGITIY